MNGTSIVQVTHNFETAHRLPFLGGKCQNLHGHSWKVEVGLINTAHEGGINEYGISIEYGLAKGTIRKWIDDHLDHGTMLGANDNLAGHISTLQALGKVFLFGSEAEIYEDRYGVVGGYSSLPWPTVEAVARMLADKLQAVLHDACGPYIYIDGIRLEETAVNATFYMPDVPTLLEKKNSVVEKVVIPNAEVV